MEEVKIFVDTNGEVILKDSHAQEYLLEYYDRSEGGWVSVCATRIVNKEAPQQ